MTKTDNRREQPKSSENTQKTTPFFTGGVPITVWRLTGLALLVGNVIKPQISFRAMNFERANSGQVRVETLVMWRPRIKFL